MLPRKSIVGSEVENIREKLLTQARDALQRPAELVVVDLDAVVQVDGDAPGGQGEEDVLFVGVHIGQDFVELLDAL